MGTRPGALPRARHYWRGDSTLSERSYATPAWLKTWAYDPSGALNPYEFIGFEPGGHFNKWISVCYSHEGALIACEVDGDAYWMGHKGTFREMFQHLAEYYRWPT